MPDPAAAHSSEVSRSGIASAFAMGIRVPSGFDRVDWNADLEDSLVVPGGHVRGVDPGGEPDRAGEGSVAELRAIRPAVLLAALGADGEDPAVKGDLDVVLRVQARQFGPDHVAVVPGRFLDAEHLACRERRPSCPRGVQPVGQVREHGAESRGRLRTRQLSHDVPPLYVRQCYLFRTLAGRADGRESSAMDGPGVTCGMTLTAQGRCSGSWYSRLEASSPVRG